MNCLEVKCLEIGKVILLAVTRSKIQKPNTATDNSGHNHTLYVEENSPFDSCATSITLLQWLTAVVRGEQVWLKFTCS